MAKLAGRTAEVRDRGNSVFENQLILRSGFQNQREFVKALDSAQQLRAVHQINRHGRLFTPGEIQKTILNVLRDRF